MLRVLFCAYITYGFFIMAITLFQALGKGKNAAIITILRSVVLFLPFVYLLPYVGGFGVKGLFVAQLATDLIVLVIAVVMVVKSFQQMTKGKTLF